MTANVRRKLQADVLALFTQGKLPEFDCEWIANLPKERQLAAAAKCLKGNDFTPPNSKPFRGRGSMIL